MRNKGPRAPFPNVEPPSAVFTALPFRIESPHSSIRCVVHQTVKNAVGHRRVADLCMPACHRQLRGQNR